MMLCCAVVHSIVWCGVLQTLEQTHSVRMCLIGSFPNLSSSFSCRILLYNGHRWTHIRVKRCVRATCTARHERRGCNTLGLRIVSDVHCLIGVSLWNGIHPPLPKHQENPSPHRIRPYSTVMVIRYRDSYDVAFVNVLGLCRVKTSGSYERMQLTQ